MTQEQLNTFLAGFKLSVTGSASEVGANDAKRRLLAHFIKGSEPNAAYELLGYKQESATVASNYDQSEITDITGATYIDIVSKAEKIEMSEYHINPAKTKFLEEAIKLKISNQEEKMQNYTILTVHGILRNSSGHCLATEETGCTVVLDNYGGQGFTMTDVTVSLSGIKKYGTVPEITATPTFTEATVSQGE